MGDAFEAFGRMILVLGFIIAILLVMARYGRKRQLAGGRRPGTRQTGRIEVLSRRSVGRHLSLVVVRVSGRTLLVGQSAQQMTLLSELDGDEWGGVQTPSEEIGGEMGGEIGKDGDIEVAGGRVFRAPGKVLATGAGAPGVWDALMDHLREMTVRR
jgi:flagellar protein FliO/FliZ